MVHQQKGGWDPLQGHSKPGTAYLQMFHKRALHTRDHSHHPNTIGSHIPLACSSFHMPHHHFLHSSMHQRIHHPEPTSVQCGTSHHASRHLHTVRLEWAPDVMFHIAMDKEVPYLEKRLTWWNKQIHMTQSKPLTIIFVSMTHLPQFPPLHTKCDWVSLHLPGKIS